MAEGVDERGQDAVIEVEGHIGQTMAEERVVRMLRTAGAARSGRG